MPENGKDVKSEAQDDKEKRDKTENNGGHAHSAKSPKKRRKVNHGTLNPTSSCALRPPELP